MFNTIRCVLLTEMLYYILLSKSSHHGWVSFECSAEIYNKTMRETNNFNHLKFQKYFQCNPKMSINEDGKYVCRPYELPGKLTKNNLQYACIHFSIIKKVCMYLVVGIHRVYILSPKNINQRPVFQNWTLWVAF